MLRVLDLSNNQLSSLPSSIGSLSHLQVLNLRGFSFPTLYPFGFLLLGKGAFFLKKLLSFLLSFASCSNAIFSSLE